MHSVPQGTPGNITSSSRMHHWQRPLQSVSPFLRTRVDGVQSIEYTLAQPVSRLQLPSGQVAMVIGFGDRCRLSLPDSDETKHFDSFVVGSAHAPLRAELLGERTCIEVRLPPWAAWEFFAGASCALDGQPVALDALLGREIHDIAERLFDLPSWPARFALLDDYLARRLVSGRVARMEIRWAWHQIEASGGCVAVTELSRALGWSHRHFACCFRNVTGMSPKSAARLVRLSRAHRELCSSPDEHLCVIASRCGFSDQAHFTRQFRDFAGCTPSEYRQRWLADAAGEKAD